MKYIFFPVAYRQKKETQEKVKAKWKPAVHLRLADLVLEVTNTPSFKEKKTCTVTT